MNVIVFTEKNKAASQIAQILSGDKINKKIIDGIPVYEFYQNEQKWKIMGLAGHIMGYDFPQYMKDWKSIDPKILLETAPVKTITKSSFAQAIISLSKDASMIILACDFDREGENIGCEAKDIAEKISSAPIKRAKFSSLSVSEINKAFSNLVEPNISMAKAADARQILDLKMGAAFTRYLTLEVRKKVRTKEILSIGPCQTPTCGFVYEREKNINNFKPEDFWRIEALFYAHGMDFNGIHRAGNIKDITKAEVIYEKIKLAKSGNITKKVVSELNTYPPYPLNTTDFLKRSSKFLSISPENALEIAEQLYLSGFTSYPRTETNKYEEDFDFRSKLVSFTNTNYKDYALSILMQKEIITRNGTKDGHDHPPIHPIKAVSAEEIKRSIKSENADKIYDLIVRHFLANLMPTAVFEKTRLEIDVLGEIFDSSGSFIKKEGWMAAYPFEVKKDKLLPNVSERDSVHIKKLQNIASKTTPPKHLTEAELLTLMDKYGIGTKATAPSHIETNKKRGYFYTKGKTIIIQETGYSLIDALNNSVSIIVKPEIRSRIESLVQEIEDNNKTFDIAIQEGTDLIKMMYEELTSNSDAIISQMVRSINETTVFEDKKNCLGKCPNCSRILHIITLEKGRFIGCTGYPECKNSYPLPKQGSLSIARSKKCLKHGHGIIKVSNKYYWSVGIGPCFTCDLFKQCYPPEILGLCPICEGTMNIITTKDSRFLGCSNRCGYTQSLPQEGKLTILNKKCGMCGWDIVRIKEKNIEAIEICVNKKCSKNI